MIRSRTLSFRSAFAPTPDRIRISSIHLKNFRSIKDAEVQLRPLTIVVGENSSGKSSLISTLRLLAQAQGHGEELPVVGLNGSEIEFGQFDDILAEGAKPKQIVIEVGFELEVGKVRFRDHIPLKLEGKPLELSTALLLGESKAFGRGSAEVLAFKASVSSAGEILEQLVMAKPGLDVTANSEFFENSMTGVTHVRLNKLVGRPNPVALRNDASADFISSVFGEFVSIDIDSPDGPSSSSPIEPLNGVLFGRELGKRPLEIFGQFFSGGYPAVLSRHVHAVDLLKQYLESIATEEIEDPYPMPIRARAKGRAAHPQSAEQQIDVFLSRIDQGPGRTLSYGVVGLMRMLRATFRESPQQVSKDILLPHFDEIADVLKARDKDWKRKYFVEVEQSVLGTLLPSIVVTLQRNINYLGPLRQGPRNLYLYGDRGNPKELGKDARFFPYFLSVRGDQKVDSLLPNSGRSRKQNLVDAVSSWAERLGVAEKVTAAEDPGYGRRVRVRLAGLKREVDWDKVGVGVSQVLPVLATVLDADKGSISLFEQPELHLHPDAQAELADFFLEAARNNRQLIVETHSDVMITRLRRRIAEANSNGSSGLNDMVSFIFVSRDRSDGSSTMRNVQTGSLGEFIEWPRGFADQAAREARELMKLQLEKLSTKDD